MRTLVLILLVLALLLTGCAESPMAKPADEGIAIGFMGDTPYSAAEVRQLDALIDSLNAQPLAFVVHVGDITNGRGPCSDAWYQARLAQFQRMRHPFILIPGDNDWTDCHRSGFDPVERLQHFRDVFEAGGQSLGTPSMALERQSDEPDFAAYREHMRWRAGGMLFITPDVQGSNNNFGRTPAMDQEYRERMRAVFAWMDEAEALVKRDNLAGLCILVQADPDFEHRFGTSKSRDTDGFADFRDKLAAMAQDLGNLGKPLLFVHGDSHRYRLDHPLRDAQGKTIDNFTRLEVPGSPWVQWVKASLHPGSPQPFYIEPGPR
jgi:hypothetical protein